MPWIKESVTSAACRWRSCEISRACRSSSARTSRSAASPMSTPRKSIVPTRDAHPTRDRSTPTTHVHATTSPTATRPASDPTRAPKARASRLIGKIRSISTASLASPNHRLVANTAVYIAALVAATVAGLARNHGFGRCVPAGGACRVPIRAVFRAAVPTGWVDGPVTSGRRTPHRCEGLSGVRQPLGLPSPHGRSAGTGAATSPDWATPVPGCCHHGPIRTTVDRAEGPDQRGPPEARFSTA